MDFQKKVRPVLQLILLVFVVSSLFGCSSVAMNFKTASSGLKDQYDIKVFKGTFSSKSDLTIVEEKAKEYETIMHYKGFEILPESTSGYGQPADSGNAEFAYTLMGAAPQPYTQYTVQFKR
jgi:hypothetical protein